MTGQFIISRMGVEAGESLDNIVARKEAERKAGSGIFWWGIGTSLGRSGFDAAKSSTEGLPVLFARTVSPPRRVDVAPAEVFLWTHWENLEGRGKIPPHVIITSHGDAGKGRHYALACRSNEPLALGGSRRFDPSRSRTVNGKVMGGSQNTALLTGDPRGHETGKYSIEFEARLVVPFCPKLVAGRLLNLQEREILKGWRYHGKSDWMALADRIRRPAQALELGKRSNY